MGALSKRARNAMKRIGKASGRATPARFHRDTNGRYYLVDGSEITGGGLYELMDAGIFVPQEDGLFPGFTQTFVLNTSRLAMAGA